MKTRIISALIGIPILIAVLFFYDGIVFNIGLAVVCVIGVYEFLRNTKYVKSAYVIIISMLFAAVVPFMNEEILQDKLYVIGFSFFVLLMFAFFKQHHTLMFQEIATALTVAVLVPYSISSFIFLRDAHQVVGLYYILLIFICAWISDAGAYFTGRLFGKTKLAPTISPKKTWEGAIGGIFFCVLFCIAYTYIYTVIMEYMGYIVKSNLIALLLISVFGSIVGIFGDLAASIVKRQTNIKDFGNLIPGHGGIIDRFDSVLFIAPFIFIVSKFVEIITLS